VERFRSAGRSTTRSAESVSLRSCAIRSAMSRPVRRKSAQRRSDPPSFMDARSRPGPGALGIRCSVFWAP
jgi:hypothetical protein